VLARAAVPAAREHLLAMSNPLELLERLAADLIERTGRLIGGAISHCNLDHTPVRALLHDLRALSERLMHEVKEARAHAYVHEDRASQTSAVGQADL